MIRFFGTAFVTGFAMFAVGVLFHWLVPVCFPSIETEFVAPEPKATYPQCVGGARACPPEDCCGPWGYANYLGAIADPQHERHEELLEWRGPFDPEAFDPKKATREMRKVRP